MSHNPYAPPATRVDDTASPQVPEVRPAQITIAVGLAAANYLLGVVAVAASWDYYSKLQSPGSMIFQQLISLALIVWIYYKIYVGRNWARITLLVLSVMTGLLASTHVARDLLMAAPAFSKVQMIVGLAIDLAILWMLFISPGRHWFRRKSSGLSPNKSLERPRGE